MKAVVIYGSMRKGSTYHIARQFVDRLSENDEVKEYFLPKDQPNFCRGCGLCLEDKNKCPDYKYIEPILIDMEKSDIIIFASATYVYHVTGQMKAFLDHFPYLWMVHRPSKAMFKKQVLIISTAAGGGTKSAMKDIGDSMFYWGTPKIYKYGCNVYALGWNDVTEENKLKISKDVQKLSNKIKREKGKFNPKIKTKALFYLMRFLNKKNKFTGIDNIYWKENGWLDNKRPWK